MRLTIRINGSESATRHAFAVLWVDTDEGLWSREAHQGMDLPTWGKVRDVEGAMALCAADSGNAVCQLKGLSFDATQREQGAVLAGNHPARGDCRLSIVARASRNTGNSFPSPDRNNRCNSSAVFGFIPVSAIFISIFSINGAPLRGVFIPV